MKLQEFYDGLIPFNGKKVGKRDREASLSFLSNLRKYINGKTSCNYVEFLSVSCPKPREAFDYSLSVD